MTNESQITQLEKRARGFRRIISALNDLPMYGINPHLDKILHVKIDALKDHLKLKITRNNNKLNSPVIIRVRIGTNIRYRTVSMEFYNSSVKNNRRLYITCATFMI